LWRQVQRDFRLDAVEVELLHELCRVLDRCDVIAAELKGQPLTVVGSTGQPRVTPLLTALENQEKLADRLASSLGVSMPNASGRSKGAGAKRKAAFTRWNRPGGGLSSVAGA
jgi:hypothetical protein